MDKYELYFDHLMVWQSHGDGVASRMGACGFRKHTRTVARSDGTRSEFFLLEQAYIELTGATSGDEHEVSGSHWTRCGAAKACHALGFAVSDPEATRRALYQCGFFPRETETHALADSGEPSWSFVFVPSSETLGPPLYFVRYLRDLGEIYSAGIGPNRITSVSRIEIAVTDPQEACGAWERFLTHFMKTERRGNSLVLESPTIVPREVV